MSFCVGGIFYNNKINLLLYTRERGVFRMGAMPVKRADTIKSPVVREYDIEGTRYIVKASVKDGATEDAAAKVRRLLRKEINKNENGEKF